MLNNTYFLCMEENTILYLLAVFSCRTYFKIRIAMSFGINWKLLKRYDINFSICMFLIIFVQNVMFFSSQELLELCFWTFCQNTKLLSYSFTFSNSIHLYLCYDVLRQ